MKKITFAIVLLLAALLCTSWAAPPAPPSRVKVTTCSNGQVAVYNSTTGDFDSCTDLAGGGDIEGVGDCATGTCNKFTVTGAITATGGFVGALTGNVTGNVTGNCSGTCGSATGNAATATALAANGSNCSAGYAPLGVDASGAVESCWQVTPAAIGAQAALSSYSTIVTLFGSGTCSGYLKSDGTCATPEGGGNVSASGAPTQYQWTTWTDGTTITGTTIAANALVGSDANGKPQAITSLPNGTTGTTQSAGDNSTKVATTAYVDTGLGGKASITSGLASALPGTCTLPAMYYATDTKTYYLCTASNEWYIVAAKGSDGTYGLTMSNNTSRSPTASTDELYFEENIFKVNQNGTESTVCIGPTAGQVTFTGPTQARSYALPDAAGDIVTRTSTDTLTNKTLTGNVCPTYSSTSTATGNINIDGASYCDYNFSNGSSAATYTPVITSAPGSGTVRYITLTVGGGSGVVTMTWTNVTFMGTSGAAATTTNKKSTYACKIPSSGNALCAIVGEAY